VLNVGLTGRAGLAGVPLGSKVVDVPQPIQHFGAELPGKVFPGVHPGLPAVKRTHQ
jgi:hypothetical protein